MRYAQESIKPYATPESKVEQVEKMFDHIAPAYDKLNHTLSWGIDKYWRRKAISQLMDDCPQYMLDVATGTGDFAIEACYRLSPKQLIGSDISEGMMDIARIKTAQAGLSHCLTFVKEDCAHLSFTDATFDAITVAFGVRNFEHLDQALSEIYRVLKPGCKLIILELSEPTWFPFKQLYSLYSKVIIPFLGKLFSKDSQAYHYLPASIKAFPQGEVMKQILLKAQFRKVGFERLTLGLCTLYVATK